MPLWSILLVLLQACTAPGAPLKNPPPLGGLLFALFLVWAIVRGVGTSDS